MRIKNEKFLGEIARYKNLESNRLLVGLLRKMRTDLDSYIETLEIMGDRELMGSINRGLKGKGIKFKDFVKKHGLEDEA